MRRILYLMTITLLLSTSVFSHDEEPHKSRVHHKYASQVNWHSLKEGLRMSENLKKPLLVDFGFEDGCHRCKYMQENIYGNDEILKKINSYFIPVFIHLYKPLTSQERQLGNKYDYKSDCLLLFMNHKSEVILNADGSDMCIVGKIEPNVFIDYLDHIIQSYNQNTIQQLISDLPIGALKND